jgi:hypothetical protein
MSSKLRASSAGAEWREDWLGRGHPARARPWAFEEQLLAPLRARERDEACLALAAELSDELAELSRMEVELHERALRVAGLQQRLDAFERPTGQGLSARVDVSRGDPAGGQTADRCPSRASVERDYWLCRCEGFEVESPRGRTGVVEGVRFLSRVDQPDLLEVRAGLFGRQLLLVPAEEVEGIFATEERLVLRSAPPRHHRQAYGLRAWHITGFRRG